jgi:hypothetical protein
MERSIQYHYLSEKGLSKPIYAIENHSVSISSLLTSQKYRPQHLYEVRYRLGWRECIIESAFIGSTENFRTLIFSNPENENKTIGIPIMNIISCSLIK